MENTTVKVLQTVMPAATTNYVVSLAPGAYRMSLAVDSNVTGTTTTITGRPLANNSPVVVGNDDLRWIEPAETAAQISLVLTAADEGRFASYLPPTASVPASGPIVLPYGLQISVAKGTAVTGEKCVITLTATQVG